MVNNKVIVKDDITDEMKAKVILDRLRTELRDVYDLRELARVIDTGDNIHISRQLVTKNVKADEKVPELEEAAISAEQYAHIDETLYKNVAHIVLSAEAQASAERNIWNDHVQGCADALAEAENGQLSTQIDTSSVATTFTEAGAWSDDTNDPYEDLINGATQIRKTKLDPNVALMDPDAYADLLGNENIVDRLERGAVGEDEVASLAGLTIRTSNTLADSDVCYIMDTAAPAVYLADGPRMAETYSKEASFADGYTIGDFIYPGDVWSAYDPDPIVKIDTSS